MVSAGLLVVFSAGFEVSELVALAVEDVLFEEVLEDVFSDEVAPDEVFTAEGSTSPKTLPPCVVQGFS